MRPEVEAHDDLGSTADQPGSSWEGQSANAPEEVSTSYPQGLAPTDLTSLPDESRKLITWLARRKMAGLDEIEQALNRKRDSVINTLEELRLKGYVKEMMVEGMKSYRVVFHAKPRRGPRGLSEDIWDRLDLDEGEPQEE